MQISKLPFDQAMGIRASIPSSSYLTFNTEEGEASDIIEYSQYEYWFDFENGSAEPESEI